MKSLLVAALLAASALSAQAQTHPDFDHMTSEELRIYREQHWVTNVPFKDLKVGDQLYSLSPPTIGCVSKQKTIDALNKGGVAWKAVIHDYFSRLLDAELEHKRTKPDDGEYCNTLQGDRDHNTIIVEKIERSENNTYAFVCFHEIGEFQLGPDVPNSPCLWGLIPSSSTIQRNLLANEER
jgi:hypothetical protein